MSDLSREVFDQMVLDGSLYEIAGKAFRLEQENEELKKEVARMVEHAEAASSRTAGENTLASATVTPENDGSRCAICGWPIDPTGRMCSPRNCSMCPWPRRYYAPERAKRDYGDRLPVEADPYVPPPSPWQPIETAPTGNWAFLAWEPTIPSMRIVVQMSPGHFEAFPDARNWSKNPTHWMPLPEPPQ